jgi:hypothetical protein
MFLHRFLSASLSSHVIGMEVNCVSQRQNIADPRIRLWCDRKKIESEFAVHYFLHGNASTLFFIFVILCYSY